MTANRTIVIPIIVGIEISSLRTMNWVMGGTSAYPPAGALPPLHRSGRGRPRPDHKPSTFYPPESVARRYALCQ
jgi:hypothetical protein